MSTMERTVGQTNSTGFTYVETDGTFTIPRQEIYIPNPFQSEGRWREIHAGLAEPFPPEEIQWRAGASTEDRKKAIALAYIDGRQVMDRLDEVVGPGNWSFHLEYLPTTSYTAYDKKTSSYAERPAIRLRGTLTVFGVPKSDVGEWDNDSANAAKSAASDALKRAAVHWGVFRYGYELPQKWCSTDPKSGKILDPPELPDWAVPHYVCEGCKAEIEGTKELTAAKVRSLAKTRFGKALCIPCGKKAGQTG